MFLRERVESSALGSLRGRGLLAQCGDGGIALTHLLLVYLDEKSNGELAVSIPRAMAPAGTRIMLHIGRRTDFDIVQAVHVLAGCPSRWPVGTKIAALDPVNQTADAQLRDSWSRGNVHI